MTHAISRLPFSLCGVQPSPFSSKISGNVRKIQNVATRVELGLSTPSDISRCCRAHKVASIRLSSSLTSGIETQNLDAGLHRVCGWPRRPRRESTGAGVARGDALSAASDIIDITDTSDVLDNDDEDEPVSPPPPPLVKSRRELQREREREERMKQLEMLDADFYRIGYAREVRCYGVRFLEGPGGVGVYFAVDLGKIAVPRVVMEIPLEVMVTITRHGPPWSIVPKILPLGHPLYDAIYATDEKDGWDLRLACLLLLAMDREDNLWHFYSDFLPPPEDTASLLLATEEELEELQDDLLAAEMRARRERGVAFWKEHWVPSQPLKMKRLARNPERFLWALGQVWSRRSLMHTVLNNARRHDSNMLIPYVDMMNHSSTPNCSYHWRKRDNMVEVVINPGNTVHIGDELTLDYGKGKSNWDLMLEYGFSDTQNPWAQVSFSGRAQIHRDSFLSAFDINGRHGEYFYNSTTSASEGAHSFCDGLLLAAAQTLPLWHDGDKPGLPSAEARAAKEIQAECEEQLAAFPSSLQDDEAMLESEDAEERSARWKAAIKYRLDKKKLFRKIHRAMDYYIDSLFY